MNTWSCCARACCPVGAKRGGVKGTERRGLKGGNCPSMLFPSVSLSDEKGPVSSTRQAVYSKLDCLVASCLQGTVPFCHAAPGV